MTIIQKGTLHPLFFFIFPYKPISLLKESVITNWFFQRGLEAGVLVWAPKLGAQKSFLVQYILSSKQS